MCWGRGCDERGLGVCWVYVGCVLVVGGVFVVCVGHVWGVGGVGGRVGDV